MSEVKNTVEFTLGYTNTDFTRKMKFDGVSSAALSGVQSGVLALNASLAAGTDGGLSSFFRSDDYDVTTDPTNPVGIFNGIVAAKAESVEETVVF